MNSKEILNCSFCEKKMREWDAVYQWVAGWERWREAGGTNALALREPEQKFACERCITLKKRGIDPQRQSELLV